MVTKKMAVVLNIIVLCIAIFIAGGGTTVCLFLYGLHDAESKLIAVVLTAMTTTFLWVFAAVFFWLLHSSIRNSVAQESISRVG